LALGEANDRYWIALGDYYMERSAEGTATLSYLNDGSVAVADAERMRERLLRELEIYVYRFNGLFTEPPRG
jgi:hypothetical protein